MSFFIRVPDDTTNGFTGQYLAPEGVGTGIASAVRGRQPYGPLSNVTTTPKEGINLRWVIQPYPADPSFVTIRPLQYAADATNDYRLRYFVDTDGSTSRPRFALISDATYTANDKFRVEMLNTTGRRAIYSAGANAYLQFGFVSYSGFFIPTPSTGGTINSACYVQMDYADGANGCVLSYGPATISYYVRSPASVGAKALKVESAHYDDVALSAPTSTRGSSAVFSDTTNRLRFVPIKVKGVDSATVNTYKIFNAAANLYLKTGVVSSPAVAAFAEMHLMTTASDSDTASEFIIEPDFKFLGRFRIRSYLNGSYVSVRTVTMSPTEEYTCGWCIEASALNDDGTGSWDFIPCP